MTAAGRAWALALALMGLLLSIAPPVGALPPTHRGATVHSLWNEQVADMDRTLDVARDLGANTVRVDVSWSELEFEGDDRYTKWYLERIDRFVRGAHARGIKVLPVLLFSPCWASGAPDPLKLNCSPDWGARGVHLYPPTSPGPYGDIVRFIAERYGSMLAGIEVWNEPNLADFLRGTDPASAYVGLVKAAYAAVNAVEPALPVVAGGLSGADREFLESLYQRGFKGNYDALSIHPYNGPHSPDAEMARRGWEFLGGIRHIKEAQKAAGDRTPMWLTEFGWNTSSLRDVSPWEEGVDEPTQAKYHARAFELLADPAQGLDYVKGAFVYELRDLSTNRLVGNENYGLVRNGFSHKPSFAAVKRAFTATTPPPEPRLSLTGLRLSRRSFRSARRGRVVVPRSRRLGRRVGARVRYRSSAPATVTFRVQRARRGKGRLVGGRCVRRTQRNRSRRRCARYRTLRGKFAHVGDEGVNRLRWSGRLRGRRLRRGRYRLIARARNDAGIRSMQVRARFRIVRR